jgi:hypothetical protein
MSQLIQLQTNKANLAESRCVAHALPEPGEGEALLKIDRVALTANNITYAAFGDSPHLRYWDFFPTGDQGWGHMPAWGFANVVASNVEGLAVGERFYGYWPIANYLLMQPVRVTERGFYDGIPHRLELVSAYNQYQRVTTDRAYQAEDENYQMLLRPLFITSFMLADFLADNDFFGAKQVLISSASSKTAYGTAFSLKGNDQVRLLGLTSAGNKDFVAGLGLYQDALAYDDVTKLDPSVPTLYVDFSGSSDLRRVIHEHFQSALMYNCFAGAAQTQQHMSSDKQELPGPKPKAYFAPNQIKKRNSDWGPAEVTRRVNDAELSFIASIKRANPSWMEINEHHGFVAAQALIRDLCNGKVDPKDGHAVVLD